MIFKTSDGLALYYDKSGKGVPLVYLHGGPGYWSKSFQYFSQNLLEEKLEMIYLDQRGCGRSEHSPMKDYSLNRVIDDIEELRKFLGISEWYVMGHSFGGILAVNYAKRFPERTKGIILSNATLNMYDCLEHQMQRGIEILKLEKQMIQRDNLESLSNSFYSIVLKLIEKGEYYKFQFVDLENKKLMDKIDEEFESDPDFQHNVITSEEYFQDFTSLTEHLTMPVLVIAGKFDNAVRPNHHQTFKFKNQQVKVLESSHHPYVESPLEFKDAILNFIKE